MPVPNLELAVPGDTDDAPRATCRSNDQWGGVVTRVVIAGSPARTNGGGGGGG